jgi:hypothetical protein
MTKSDEYRARLRSLKSWDAYLLQESGLPGPRGNLELAQVVADEGDLALFRRYLTYTYGLAPVNSPYEFLAFCGVVGLGRVIAESGGTNANRELVEDLRGCASDPRWRLREGVAMALQRIGEVDMEGLLVEMGAWGRGIPLEQRAAAAALCEPRLLGQPEQVRQVLQILDHITASIADIRDRRSPDFLALRKGLGYCWSVAVAALPDEGKASMERWLAHPDKDIRWIMRENLKKKRLLRLDAEWVEKWRGAG